MCKCIEKRLKEYTSNFREHYPGEEHRFLVRGGYGRRTVGVERCPQSKESKTW